jgi:hypothetical protein
MKARNFGDSVPFTLEVGLLLISCVKLSSLSLNCVKVIDVILKNIRMGNCATKSPRGS